MICANFADLFSTSLLSFTTACLRRSPPKISWRAIFSRPCAIACHRWWRQALERRIGLWHWDGSSQGMATVDGDGSRLSVANAIALGVISSGTASHVGARSEAVSTRCRNAVTGRSVTPSFPNVSALLGPQYLFDEMLKPMEDAREAHLSQSTRTVITCGIFRSCHPRCTSCPPNNWLMGSWKMK